MRNPRQSFSRRVLHDSGGTSAIEFAIVAPVFLAMVVGGIYMCMMLFAMGSLQEAVEAAARCWAVNTTVCTSASSAQDYATSHYYGPSYSPTFTATNPSCGYQVAGAITYSWNFYYSTVSVPLNAVACFP